MCKDTLIPAGKTGLRDYAFEQQEDGTTLISGYLSDQAALYGALLQLIRLGLVLLSLDTSEVSGGEQAAERS